MSPTILSTLATPRRSIPKAARAAARFLLHGIEMILAMMIGMAVLGVPVAAIARSAGIADLYHDLPVLGTLVMAAIMTGPMAAWMAIRGHDRRMIGEMSLAMIAPALGLIAASAAELVAARSIPMLADPMMFVAMLVAMVVRWRVYAGVGHEGHARHAAGRLEVDPAAA